MRRALLGVVSLLAVAARAFSLDITSCDQAIPDHELGTLQTDLSCAGAFVGVHVGAGATLAMNGHTITGSFANFAAVECSRNRCTVLGPGEIRDGDFEAIRGLGSRLRVSDLLISRSGTGIASGGALEVRNVTIREVRTEAIRGRKVTASHLTVTGGGAVTATRARLVSSEVSNNRAGILADRIVLDGVSVLNNGLAFFGGIQAGRAVIRRSIITGNDGSGTGIDVATARRPRIDGLSVCGKSQQLSAAAGVTWGICTNDGP